MAPELRKKKSKTVLVEEVATTVVPAVKKAAKKTEKRKANEDASPIATKKQKAVKTKKVIVEEVVEEEPIPSPVPKKSALKKEKAAKKGKKAAPEPEPVVEAEEEDQVDDAMPSDNDEAEQQEGDDDEVDAKTQALVDAYDSGDDNDSDSGAAPVSTFKKGQDVGKAPKPKKGTTTSSKPSGKPGVMYLGSIPHGFYEHEIREYFSQFGAITRLRVVRSKKTGASRHRAFVEFADAEVADIAARTMDSYLLFGHILRARVVDPSQVHPNLFKGANRRFKPVPWNKMAGRHLERPLGETKWAGRISKEERRRAARAEKLKAIGYEFEAPQLKVAEAKEQIEAPPAEEAAKAVEAPEPMQVEEAVAEVVEEKVEEAPKTISAGKGKKAKATKKKVKSKA
ncbi:putative RNA-binding protein [Podospora conica]|nr:putative RNA-binding protein [Schizothecium conicum]